VITNAAVFLYDSIPTGKRPEAPKAAAAAGAPQVTSELIFKAIGAYLGQHPELVKQVSTVYQFNLKSPASAYTIDLKNGAAGTVTPGNAAKADCTLELSDADWLDMTSGKADPQKLFMSGKLKITGNVMASQKLEFLKKIDRKEMEGALAGAPASAAPAAEAAVTSGAIFQAIGAYLGSHPELVKQVNTVYQFNLKNPASAYVLDLKSGATGTVTPGNAAKADCTLELSDADWLDMTSGKADPQKLFMSGKLKITGNVMASQKLEFLKKLDKGEVEAAMKKAPAPAAAASSSGAPASANAPKVLAALKERLSKSPQLAKEVNAVVVFKVKDPDAIFVGDFIKGEVRDGAADKANLTLTMTDEVLTQLAKGEQSLRDLYMHGAIRADGDILIAQRLGLLKQLI
jgi:3-hydroxyacyl-CoA dehydrogenase/3a,7a,12a-trihydroxy-5b-cholest-24-enoyl-CoA hydratase